MEFIRATIDFIIHINAHLDALVAAYGSWTYAILFLIVFAETGLVVTPFLPGDSLLFAAGAIASRGGLDPVILIVVLLAAAIIGDTVNYWIGRAAGEHLLSRYPRLVNPAHLERTRRFFARYGGKTIILSRFVPIVRTLAPFVAGAGEMTYAKFMRFNVMGAFIWVFLFVPAGYFFASIPFVEEHFSLVLIGVIFVSLLPPIAEYLREAHMRRKRPPPVDSQPGS